MDGKITTSKIPLYPLTPWSTITMLSNLISRRNGLSDGRAWRFRWGEMRALGWMMDGQDWSVNRPGEGWAVRKSGRRYKNRFWREREHFVLSEEAISGFLHFLCDYLSVSFTFTGTKQGMKRSKIWGEFISEMSKFFWC